MPYDYTIKGWPSPITLGGNCYAVSSCDQNDSGLCYSQAGVKNPHITIHNVNKEGPDDWNRSGGGYHVRVSNTKLYEYAKGKPDDFVVASGSKKGELATGAGSADQTKVANALAAEFYTLVYNKITGKT